MLAGLALARVPSSPDRRPLAPGDTLLLCGATHGRVRVPVAEHAR